MYAHFSVLMLAAVLPIIAQSDIAITSVNVVDVVAGKTLADQTVLIHGALITAVGPSASTTVPSGARVVNGQGQYLIPGLWDMHIHLRSNPAERDKTLADENAAMLELFVANGVVGVREMGGDLSDHIFTWRNEIRSGKRIGPRIVTPGRKLDVAEPSWPGSLAVTTPEEARNAVVQMKEKGADFIKVYFAQVEQQVFKSVMDEAHRVGLKVTGHLPTNLSLQTAFEVGLDGIEHSTLDTPLQTEHDRFVLEIAARRKQDLAMDAAESLRRRMFIHDSKEADRVYAQLAKRSFWVTPTMVVQARVRYEIAERTDFDNDTRRRYFFPAIWRSWDTKSGMRRPPAPAVLDLWKRSVKASGQQVLAAHKAGVPILVGTDCGVSNNYMLPGWSLHEEMEALVKLGMTPAEVLRSATLLPAKWRKEEATEGTVENGKRADLVLLRSNPLNHISSTREIESVWMGGEFFPRTRLDALLRIAAERAAPAWSALK